MRGCSVGACVVARGGHGCSGGGGGGRMRGCSGGACMVALGACMVARGGAWLLWGACVAAPGGGACVHGFFDDIRSMSRRYASYWNAFLLLICIDIFPIFQLVDLDK